MSKIAVDVVLFPSDDASEKAIVFSKKILSSSKEHLNKHDFFPHISLNMGCVEERDVQKIKTILETIAKRFHPLKLKISDSYTNKITDGTTVAAWKIEKEQHLQSLHELVIKKLNPYFTADAQNNNLYDPPAINQLTLSWINNYQKNAAFDKFLPHITLGFEDTINTSTIELSIDFTASELALCHLGNYCSCRKKLFSVHLQD